MVAAAGLHAYVSHVPDRDGEIVIEFDPSSYSDAVDGPAMCRVVVPVVTQQVATAWPTTQVGARMAYPRLQRRR